MKDGTTPLAAFVFTNSRGRQYTLCEVSTNRGAPRLVMAGVPRGRVLAELPEGYEVVENPNGQVSVRRQRTSLISTTERNTIESLLRSGTMHSHCKYEVKGDSIVVHEHLGGGRFQAMLRFHLVDSEKRTFSAERFCFRGSVDGWISLDDHGPLQKLARRYLPHIGQESFYELH